MQPSLSSKILPRGSQVLLACVALASRVELPFVLLQGIGVPDGHVENLILCLVPTSAHFPHLTHVHSFPWGMNIFQILGCPALNFLPLTRNLFTTSFQYAEPSSHWIPFLSPTSHCTPQYTSRLWRHELGSTSLMHQPKTLTQGLRTPWRRQPGVCTMRVVGYSSTTWFPGHLCII